MATVLVLDDRAVERELFETVLGSADHTVLQASSGEQALALARDAHPDLIIADILLPGMDGYEFARALREDSATATIQVILCTATYGEPEVQRLATACGVSQILIKPLEPLEILQAVEAALDAGPAPRSVERFERFEREHVDVANAKLIEKVDELERAEQHRRLLAAIVESSEDAIVATASDGTIASWNSGAEKLYA